MNKNMTIAIVVGLMVFYAAGTAFIVLADTSESTDLDINIIARCNINGSGIFADVPLTLDPTTPEEVAAWGGLVFMTPGASSIQHFMLNRFVVDELGMEFVMYTGTTSPNKVYWTPIAPVLMKQTYLDNAGIYNGGFPWDPFYAEIRVELGITLPTFISSADMEQDHPCCVVAAKASYLSSNEGAVLRFLSAYTEALEWVSTALTDVTSSDYSKLMEITTKFTGIKNTTILSEAFKGLTYMYELDTPLGRPLEECTEDLIVSFGALGIITKPVDDPTAFAKEFINHRFMDRIIDEGRTETYPSRMITIRVGHLVGDIHQIGLVAGMELGLFEKYGVKLITVQVANGPAVMSLFQLGVIDIGILGLPPAVSNTANFR
ncbi:MAG: hypothetical protein LBV13_04530 [Methanomassiliicoccaceae archaeon]|nr:hypothetical protein [Methanomassiliicoccaceae archaeon]